MHLTHSKIQKSEKILLLSVNQSWCVCVLFGVCPEWTNVIVTHQKSKLFVMSSGKKLIFYVCGKIVKNHCEVILHAKLNSSIFSDALLISHCN